MCLVIKAENYWRDATFSSNFFSLHCSFFLIIFITQEAQLMTRHAQGAAAEYHATST